MLGVDGAGRGRGPVPGDGARGHGAAQLGAHVACARGGQAEQETLRGGHGAGDVHREDRVETVKGESIHALFPHDRHAPAVALQLTRNLCGRGQRVVLGGHRADAHARVKGNESLRAVRQRNGHRVPGPNPGLVQDARGAQHLIAHLRVGGGCPEVVQGDAIGVEAGGGVEERVQRGVRRGHLVGHCVVEVVCLVGDATCHGNLLSSASTSVPRDTIPLIREGCSRCRTSQCRRSPDPSAATSRAAARCRASRIRGWSSPGTSTGDGHRQSPRPSAARP